MPRKTRASLKAELQDQSKASPSPPVSTASPPGSIPILTFKDESGWEDWLRLHCGEQTGVWLQISKKNSGIPTVSYDEALDVALCYGWIDGQRKTHDEQYFIQRFTPRRKNSLWSKRNVGKVAALIEQKRMTPPGQAEIDAAKADGRWDRAYSSASTMEVPLDFQQALAGNPKASKFFEALNKTQRYAFLWRIETTKRPETRKRKIGEYVDLLAQHKPL
ncbi:hypothetical protein EsH8_VII_000991 [Colletotrichum jinshuiense]